MKEYAKEFEKIQNKYMMDEADPETSLDPVISDILKAQRCLYLLMDEAGLTLKNEMVRDLLKLVAEEDLSGKRKIPTEFLAEKCAIAIYALYTLSHGRNLWEPESTRG